MTWKYNDPPTPKKMRKIILDLAVTLDGFIEDPMVKLTGFSKMIKQISEIYFLISFPILTFFFMVG